MIVYFSLVSLDLLKNILSFKFSGATLLVHNINGLLFGADLAIDIIKLTAEPLRNLTFGGDSRLELLVLDHLVRGVAAQVRDLRMQLTLKVVKSDVLVLLPLVLLLEVDAAPLKSLVL